MIGNTDDIGDIQINFLNEWSNVCDVNGKFTIKVYQSEFLERKLYFKRNIQLVLSGDLHMIWNAVGSINNRNFFIVFFGFYGDATDIYHHIKINGVDVWMYFTFDPRIGLKQFLDVKQYSITDFQALLESNKR